MIKFHKVSFVLFSSMHITFKPHLIRRVAFPVLVPGIPFTHHSSAVCNVRALLGAICLTISLILWYLVRLTANNTDIFCLSVRRVGIAQHAHPTTLVAAKCSLSVPVARWLQKHRLATRVALALYSILPCGVVGSQFPLSETFL